MTIQRIVNARDPWWRLVGGIMRTMPRHRDDDDMTADDRDAALDDAGIVDRRDRDVDEGSWSDARRIAVDFRDVRVPVEADAVASLAGRIVAAGGASVFRLVLPGGRVVEGLLTVSGDPVIVTGDVVLAASADVRVEPIAAGPGRPRPGGVLRP